MPEVDELELERLRNEVTQEWQIVQSLTQSLDDLSATASDLENKLDGTDDECCEWKTRYELQIEMNQLIKMQAAELGEKVDELTGTMKDGKLAKFPTEVTSKNVKQLEQSKQFLENHLRELEWRLEQEAKANHKANEERKMCVVEIGDAHGHAENLRSKSRQDFSNPVSPRTPSFGNIAPDQRILDVRRGPIRRTAAVKTLPRID